VSVGFKFQLLPRMKGFIGEFAKLKKKKTMSLVMAVCPSGRNSSPTGRILMILDT